MRAGNGKYVSFNMEMRMEIDALDIISGKRKLCFFVLLFAYIYKQLQRLAVFKQLTKEVTKLIHHYLCLG